MSQSLLYHAFGVREGYEYRRTEYHDGVVQFHLAVKEDQFVCPECQSRNVIRKGARQRSLQTVPIGFKAVFLVTEVPKCECKDCGAKFELPPLLPRPMCTTPKSSRRTRTRSAG
jgi:transposase